MANTTPSGMKGHCESAEWKSYQIAKFVLQMGQFKIVWISHDTSPLRCQVSQGAWNHPLKDYGYSFCCFVCILLSLWTSCDLDTSGKLWHFTPNWLITNDFSWSWQKLSLWCHFWQHPWDCTSKKGRDRRRWVYLKGTNNVVASGLGCRKALIGTVWAISLLLCMAWLRKHHLALRVLHFWQWNFVCMANVWLRAVNIEKSSMSWCGLQRMAAKAVEWSFERQNPWEPGMFKDS